MRYDIATLRRIPQENKTVAMVGLESIDDIQWDFDQALGAFAN